MVKRSIGTQNTKMKSFWFYIDMIKTVIEFSERYEKVDGKVVEDHGEPHSVDRALLLHTKLTKLRRESEEWAYTKGKQLAKNGIYSKYAEFSENPSLNQLFGFDVALGFEETYQKELEAGHLIETESNTGRADDLTEYFNYLKYKEMRENQMQSAHYTIAKLAIERAILSAIDPKKCRLGGQYAKEYGKRNVQTFLDVHGVKNFIEFINIANVLNPENAIDITKETITPMLMEYCGVDQQKAYKLIETYNKHQKEDGKKILESQEKKLEDNTLKIEDESEKSDRTKLEDKDAEEIEQRHSQYLEGFLLLYNCTQKNLLNNKSIQHIMIIPEDESELGKNSEFSKKEAISFQEIKTRSITEIAKSVNGQILEILKDNPKAIKLLAPVKEILDNRKTQIENPIKGERD